MPCGPLVGLSIVDATQPGGLVFVIGVGKSHIDLPFMHFSTNEITLKFLFRYRDTWPRAIRLVSAGKIDVKRIVTARFPLEQAKEAVEVSERESEKRWCEKDGKGSMQGMRAERVGQRLTVGLRSDLFLRQHAADRSKFSVKTLIVDGDE